MSLQSGDFVTPIPWEELTSLFPTFVDEDGELRVRIDDLSFDQAEVEPFEGFVFEVAFIDTDGEVIFTEETLAEFEDFGLSLVFFTEDMLRKIDGGTSPVNSSINIDEFLNLIS